MSDTADDPAAPFPPTSCPFCGSTRIISVHDRTTLPEDQYWHCETCHQVWNPGRLHPPSEHNPRSPRKR
jgi:transposase-like protein